MIKNYFTIAWRNLWRNKGFSAINIAGLAIGIATCLLIILYVSHETGYDRFNEKSGRIVRVFFQGEIQGQKMKESTVMAPVAGVMKTDYPEVEDATRLRSSYEKPKIMYDGKTFRDDVMAYADANFFSVFTLPFVQGNAATALAEPNTMVLTETVAKKYFGNAAAMGRVIGIKGKDVTYKITGVMKDIPANSHFQFGLLASMQNVAESKEANWMSSNFYTYLLLKEGYDHTKLEVKLPQLVEKYIGPQMKEGTGQTLAEFRKSGSDLSFHLQPLTDIHLHSDFNNDLSQPGNVQYIYIFSAIAIFMLLIACINFMNLSTASASKRSKEVGVRKVLGSMRKELVEQFLTESVVVAAIALVLSIGLIYLALPFFNELTGLQLSPNIKEHPLLLPGLLLFVLFTGMIAGSYPALYLSSFKPVVVLKGKLTKGKEGASIRSGLVVFQFFISIILIVSTIVVYNQLSFIQNKDIGYNKDKVMILPNTWQLGKNREIFRQQLEADPRVASVSGSRYLPAGASDNNNFFVTTDKHPDELIKTLRYEVDEKYIATLGIKIKEGRNFSAAYGTDSNAIIINEAAVKALGLEQNAIGHTISRTSKRGEKENYSIVGVVNDFHFRSLHEQISPLLMVLAPDEGNLIVKLKTKDAAGLTKELQKRFVAYGAEDPLDYSFLDERYSAVYKTEQKAGTILAVFACLTIFVACMGLFGLAKFTAQQRTKEIGIRKVLGASVTQMSTMLSKEFIKLVLISCIIAFPLSWWAMNKWLQDFAYRVDIGWQVFIVAAIIALVIALITVSWQAIKAAIANPVKSLRTE